MNKNRLTPASNPALDKLPTAELVQALNRAQGYGKAQVLFAIARRMHLEPTLKSLLLSEVASTENQSTVAQFNDSVAMAAAFAVVDEGSSADIELLKGIVAQWQNPYHAEDFYWTLKENNITI